MISARGADTGGDQERRETAATGRGQTAGNHKVIERIYNCMGLCGHLSRVNIYVIEWWTGPKPYFPERLD